GVCTRRAVSPHGRTVRRPRRDHAHRHATPPRGAARGRCRGDGHRADGGVRDALDRRGGVPVGPGGRALDAAGTRGRRRPYRAAAPTAARRRGHVGVLHPRDRAAPSPARRARRVNRAATPVAVWYVVGAVALVAGWEALVRLLEVRPFVLLPP